MTIKRGIYAAVAISVLGATLWVLRRHHDKQSDVSIMAPTLQPGDIDRIIVSPRRHTIEVIGKHGSQKQFLPDSGASVDIRKDGRGSISVRTWGTEVVPFLGFSLGSDIKARAVMGLNLFYIQRWEGGAGLLVSSDSRDTRLFAHVGYNVYDNAVLSVGVDNRKTVHCIVSLKF
jgi:hypothetical protein